jgi:hypothetical protein
MTNIITAALFLVFICIGGFIFYDANTQIVKALGIIVSVCSLGFMLTISKLQEIIDLMEDADDSVEKKES